MRYSVCPVENCTNSDTFEVRANHSTEDKSSTTIVILINLSMKFCPLLGVLNEDVYNKDASGHGVYCLLFVVQTLFSFLLLADNS